MEGERSGAGGAADVEIERRGDEQHRAVSVGETVESHGRSGHRRRSSDGSDPLVGQRGAVDAGRGRRDAGVEECCVVIPQRAAHERCEHRGVDVLLARVEHGLLRRFVDGYIAAGARDDGFATREEDGRRLRGRRRGGLRLGR